MLLMAKKKVSQWARRLKRLRANLELTQAQFAERLDVPLRTIINWENSLRNPSKMAQRVIAQIFPDC